ncbi:MULTISPECIES: lipase family protein [unclassified Frankia]|uniref:lipase family protein n=1 Tax=unclassified Frankia TaxID=2632575 RepID=UPI001EF58855|nr:MULTISPECIES: lipase family protein [unclassified Frankia]
MLVTTVKAPSPLEPSPSQPDGLPVYPNLVADLLQVQVHPNDTVAHVLATCAGYAYERVDSARTKDGGSTFSETMARLGLEGNRCRIVADYVDGMLLWSTAFILQSQDGRIGILAYRGTEPTNLLNWFAVADIEPEDFKICVGNEQDPKNYFDVHAGFYRNTRATSDKIVEILRAALQPVTNEGAVNILGERDRQVQPLERLYITGHSYGAAIASMMGIMLKNNARYQDVGQILHAVYTFGQPMIGSPALALACKRHEFLGRNVIRYVYRNDPVPRLPPSASGHFAHYPEHELRYSRKWPWIESPASSQTNDLFIAPEALLGFVERQMWLLRHLHPQYSVVDHLPQNYIAALIPPGIRNEFGELPLP